MGPLSLNRRRLLAATLVSVAALSGLVPAQARNSAVDARGKDLKDKQGLIAHAVPVLWQDLSQPDLPTKGRLIGDDVLLSKKLQALGVSKNQPIVVLGDPANGWGEDGRVARTLRPLGHAKAVIVDGGLPALLQLGKPAIQAPKLPGDVVVARTSHLEVRKEVLKDRLGKANTVIFDVREPREYEGKTPCGESRGGHVPGAKGLWYKDLIGKDGNLLPRPEIVSYCTGGIRPGWLTLLLNDLGYKAKNCTDSMWEWSASPADQYPLVKN